MTILGRIEEIKRNTTELILLSLTLLVVVGNQERETMHNVLV